MRFFSAFASLFIFSVIFSFSGCSDSVTNSTGTSTRFNQARTEREFQTHADLKADPGAVIYIGLEHLNTPPGLLTFDTGNPGEDIISYHYSETTQQRIRLRSSANLKVRLISDASNTEIYNLTPALNSVIVTIPAGDYKLYLTSLINYGSDSLNQQEVFIQLDTNTIVSGNINTFIADGECFQCKLDHADLSFLNMRYIGLSECSIKFANLYHSSFEYANIHSCDLTQADISNVNFSQSIMDNSSFTDANLSNVNLSNGSFEQMNFTGVNLGSANLSSSSIRFSNFSNANLTNANISNSEMEEVNFCGATKTGLISTGVTFNGNMQCWP